MNSTLHSLSERTSSTPPWRFVVSESKKGRSQPKHKNGGTSRGHSFYSQILSERLISWRDSLTLVRAAPRSSRPQIYKLRSMEKAIKTEVEEVEEVDASSPPVESHDRTATTEAREPRKAFGKLQSGEGSSKKNDPKFVVLALPCRKYRKTMMRRSRAAAVQRRWEEEEEEAIANEEAVHETSPNPGNERESYDPNSVVLTLPCPTPTKAAARGRVAAEASSRARDSGWCPPPPDVYKINVHGISFSDDGTGDAGIGLVVRDFKGDLIAAMSRKVKGGSYSGSITDCAISLGLELGHDLGLTRVFMEGDFANLGNDHLCSSFLLLNKESVQKYSICKYGYVKEEANLVAHKLACYAVRLEDSIVWMEDPPDFIEGVLALDSRGIKSM